MKIILAAILFLFVSACGKKQDPEYRSFTQTGVVKNYSFNSKGDQYLTINSNSLYKMMGGFGKQYLYTGYDKINNKIIGKKIIFDSKECVKFCDNEYTTPPTISSFTMVSVFDILK